MKMPEANMRWDLRWTFWDRLLVSVPLEKRIDHTAGGEGKARTRKRQVKILSNNLHKPVIQLSSPVNQDLRFHYKTSTTLQHLHNNRDIGAILDQYRRQFLDHGSNCGSALWSVLNKSGNCVTLLLLLVLLPYLGLERLDGACREASHAHRLWPIENDIS